MGCVQLLCAGVRILPRAVVAEISDHTPEIAISALWAFSTADLVFTSGLPEALAEKELGKLVSAEAFSWVELEGGIFGEGEAEDETGGRRRERPLCREALYPSACLSEPSCPE